MSKVLVAACDANSKVTVSGIEVDIAQILSEGKKASTGIVILNRDKAFYLTSNATDIKDLIIKLVDIVNQIATVASGLDGATNSPGAQASAIAQIQTLKGELDAMKGTLK